MTLGRVPYHEQSTRNKFYITPRKDEDIFERVMLRGCPRQLYLTKPFLLQDNLKTITSAPDGLKPKSISREVQIEGFKQIHGNPFAAPYVMSIASEPNALRASLVAMNLMMRACMYLDMVKEGEKLKHKEYPLWHMLDGSYKDSLRDGKKRSLSLLVLANITVESGPTKLEKLTDLLEKYNDTPRIVLLTGTDPLTFFHTYLYYHINYAMFLSGNRAKVRNI